MKRLWVLCLWGTRDAMRRPVEAILPASALATLVFLTAVPLILSQGMSDGIEKLLKNAPSLVIRRVSPMGWMPLPEGPAIQAAQKIPGVNHVRTRLWGTASTPDGAVTVITGNTLFSDFDPTALETTLKPGEAWIGDGVTTSEDNDRIIIGNISFTVAGRFPPQAGAAAHDLVWLNKSDAHRILGIPKGFASDLVADVFWEKEVDAVLPELSTAFPWPVRITTRKETIGEYAGAFTINTGRFILLLIPSVLAMAFIVAGVVRERLGNRKEVGLLKVMGWNLSDIVWCQLCRSLIFALPATGIGVFFSYITVVFGGGGWAFKLLFDWKTDVPFMVVEPAVSILLLFQVAALILMPYLAAVLFASVASTTADPQDLLTGESMG
jgi:hypothetical protein